MWKLISAILISILLLLILAVVLAPPTTAQSPPPPKGPEATPSSPNASSAPLTTPSSSLLLKIEPQLLKKLLQSGAQPVSFIVYLKATTDLSAAAQALGPQTLADPLARRTAMIAALQQTARDSQMGVLQTLNGAAGQPAAAAAAIQPLWIVNAVAAAGSLDMVLALADRPEVEIVRLDKEIEIRDRQIEPHQQSSASNLPSLSPEWGVAKIRADLVHNALGLTGAGIVVGNIDTGVDWQHPALQSRYRGYLGSGKLPLHTGNWFDATGAGASYPVDSGGHGTHTMGTMIGANGLGVAPGAQWIAVRAFNSQGLAQTSWLHRAFEWILAPDDNPALAPQVVNNSWSNSAGASTEFQADLQALLNAGIYPVFSAGNDGPDSGTVGSPGSLNLAFAVGATNNSDEVANFSSRGPSPWGQIKPEVVAPGKDIYSSLPGGTYGEMSGTSMAAPHTAGLVALMLQASPSLTNNLSQLSYVITSTAVRLGSVTPNNDNGWGRIDAYNAVMAVGSFGLLQGTVTRAGGPAISNAVLQISPHGGGPVINTSTQTDGSYRQGLAANTYDVTVTAFGYLPASVYGIKLVTGATVVQNFSLTPQPTGSLTGIVRDKATGQPLTAAIVVKDTPISVTTNTNGAYNLSLPVGVYTVTAIAAAHRITQAVNVTIYQGLTTSQNFALDPAPRILVVDSGRWYQESQLGYYRQALDDQFYPYDTWVITTTNDVPVTSTLTAYDLVIWSSPLDSPGYVGADAAMIGFLQAGGKLFLSGQDVAYYDSGSADFGTAYYFRQYLKAALIEDDAEVFTVTGVAAGPLAGLALTLTGGDGADNQISPDVIEVTDGDFAGPLLAYGSNAGLAGLKVGLCLPYRAIFLPFGFEAINSRADRSQTLGRAIDWLKQSPAATGIELTPLTATLVGNFNQVVSHPVRVRNTGANADTFTLTLTPGQPYHWPVNPGPPSSLALPACESQTLTIGVKVAINNTWAVSDTFTLAAVSANNPAFRAVTTRTTQSPAPVLLVDDDRWYSFAAEYQAVLQANHLPYDYWLVPKSGSGVEPLSPPLETLQMYPMVVWYTAYDWYQPLTTAEEERLAAYLDSGGRLMFSSQDYIYNLPDHRPSNFAQTYLGILDHVEDFSSTVVIGQAGSPVGHGLGSFPLTFPPSYTNWTDALTPTTAAQVATRGQAGQPNSLTNQGRGRQPWHTHFLAFGPELLAESDRARFMQRSLGWLSWLGSSTVTPNVSASLDGQDVTYTAILTNDGWIDLPAVVFTATFPAELTPGSHSSDLSLVGGNLVWSGPLAQNTPKVLTYTTAIAASLPLGTTVKQVSWLAYPEHQLLFDRMAQVRVNFPDLETSSLVVTPSEGVEAGEVLTYTLTLKNTGLVDDPLVTITNTLPPTLQWLGVDPPGQGLVTPGEQGFTWTTSLARQTTAILTYRAVISYRAGSAIENTAIVDDHLNEPLPLTARAAFKVFPAYLPVILK